MDAHTTTKPLPPAVEGHWLFKKVIPIARDFIDFLERNRKEHGGIYYVPIRKENLVILTEPEHIKYVLQDNNRNYFKSFGYEVLKLFLGEGLLTSDGDTWLRQRRLAQPAFHKRRLAQLARFMTEESRQTALDLEAVAREGGTIDVMHEMLEVTLKIVARALFSANVDHDIPVISENMERLNHFAISRIQSPIRLPMWMPTLRQLVFKSSATAVNDVLFRIIQARREERGSQSHDDLLEMLMEAQDADTGEAMSDEQLRDECMTIFVAGHETTAVSMTWTLHLLARHPDVYEKLHAELVDVLGDREPDLEDLPKLRYTRHVIDEALRLYPPGWLLGRKNLEDDEIGGYHIPAGTNVLLATLLVHTREDLWDRAHDFWPERWDTEAVQNLHKMAYFPFGGGPRLCIGNNFALMEMTILLATMARRFQPRLVDDEEVPMDPLITLRPKGKVELKITTPGAH